MIFGYFLTGRRLHQPRERSVRVHVGQRVGRR